MTNAQQTQDKESHELAKLEAHKNNHAYFINKVDKIIAKYVKEAV